MLGLTKLISFGLTGLSTSGLSFYFIPKYFEDNSQPSQLIYKEGISFSGSNVSSFENNEESVLQDLKKLYEKFQKVDKHLEDKKGARYVNLQEIFKKVDDIEEELKRLYVGNKNLFEQLQQLGNKTFERQKEKLEVEVELNKLKYFNESMKKANAVIRSWRNSISSIICAIDGGVSGCGISSQGAQFSNSSARGGANTSFEASQWSIKKF